ncbi:MAG: hypothetical protein GC154_17680 [bacterium]|nr:hypothetical protein [bacterium]
MKKLASILIYAAVVSIIVGIAFKVLQIDLSAQFSTYPVRPLSFVNFSEVILLLAIALLLKDK